MAQQSATTETAARAAKTLDRAPVPDPGEDSQAARLPAPADREQAVREAAYACFEARGCAPGHELDDWLKAEAQVEQASCVSAAAGGAGQVAH